MEGDNLLFDIRNKDKAAKTLERLTGVNETYWSFERMKNSGRYDYTNADEDIERIISKYGGHFPNIVDIELVVTHLTTSNNHCKEILDKGIIDLRKAYANKRSELRYFLEQHGIEIFVDDCCLKYDGLNYDISYGKCPRDSESIEYAAWSVGRRIYYDFTVCGFLSMNSKRPYGGMVHRRPEILSDIDGLLCTNLQAEWFQTHKSYEVIFKIPVLETVYDGWDTDDEDEMVMKYLLDAYMCISTEPDTKEIICKNGIEILPAQIIECNRFRMWK